MIHSTMPVPAPGTLPSPTDAAVGAARVSAADAVRAAIVAKLVAEGRIGSSRAAVDEFMAVWDGLANDETRDDFVAAIAEYRAEVEARDAADAP